MTDTPDSQDEQMQRTLRAYAKRELRTRMQALRNVLPASAHAERSARACRLIVELPRFGAARTIAGYVAMRKELDLRAALQHASAQGQRVVLPRIAEQELTFHVQLPDQALQENAWGVLEPAPEAERVELSEIDLLLIPALALDLRGQRIGYGKGYYDRMLSRMPDAYTVGSVYDFQLLAEIPNEAQDVPVQHIITDSRSLPASG